jgi:hypothetical protein
MSTPGIAIKRLRRCLINGLLWFGNFASAKNLSLAAALIELQIVRLRRAIKPWSIRIQVGRNGTGSGDDAAGSESITAVETKSNLSYDRDLLNARDYWGTIDVDYLAAGAIRRDLSDRIIGWSTRLPGRRFHVKGSRALA